MRLSLKAIYFHAVFFMSFSAFAIPAQDVIFQCDGSVEMTIWSNWDTTGKIYVSGELIEKRLIAAGDASALYDIEIVLHNLLAMAGRCERKTRIVEIAVLIFEATYALEPLTNKLSDRKWICTGGAVCSKNDLLNKEVLLYSVQFLAFAVSVFNHSNVVFPNDLLKEISLIATGHLERWNSIATLANLKFRIAASPDSLLGQSSIALLRDTDLWQIVIYAELAGIFSKYPKLGRKILNGKYSNLVQPEKFAFLLKLMRSRMLITTENINKKDVEVATIDAGYWNKFREYEYAGYTGAKPPISCDSGKSIVDPKIKNEARLSAAKTLGWDLSHSRRAVHLMNSLKKNERQIADYYKFSSLPAQNLRLVKALATQLRYKVWNGNSVQPLFANYFSGDNGWYRVGYKKNGRQTCNEGIGPYGLSIAFLTGGFGDWGQYDSKLLELGRTLYFLMKSTNPLDVEFIERYYSQLSSQRSRTQRQIAELTALPSLVH